MLPRAAGEAHAARERRRVRCRLISHIACMTISASPQSARATLPQEPDNSEEPIPRRRRHMGMNRNTPFFITASLLIATLSVALPDLDLETVAETQAREATAHGATGARDAAAASEAKS